MCRLVCIGLGVVAAALAWFFLQGLVSAFPLALIALFTFIATAWMLYEAFCGKESSTATGAAAAGAGVAAAGVAASKVGGTDRDAASADDAGTSSAAAETQTPVASFVDTGAAKPEKAKKPATRKTAAKSTTAKTKTAKPKTAATKKAAPRKAAPKKAAAKSAGPERLTKPKGGKADDLKLIAGVGPKLEKTLNGLGFFHFEQIAKWKKADVAIVDDELSFKGRIERDDWIKQAKALAKGGEAEYIKVFGKKPR